MTHKTRESIDQQQRQSSSNANWQVGYHFVIYKGMAGAAYFSKADYRWHVTGIREPLDDVDFDFIYSTMLVEEKKTEYRNLLIGLLGGLLCVILIFILSMLDLL